MSGHTPGPWVQDEWGNIKTSPGETITVEGGALAGRSTAETRANARLIAAAPDLLYALRILVDQYQSSGDFTMGGNLTNKGFLLGIEAIAKATGEAP